MLHFLDPLFLIKTLGLIGIIAIVFAESGLLFGFFFPGDSLLFTAGFLASQGYFPIWILVFGCTLAAILGDNVGYMFGKRLGVKIFSKEDSFFFNKKHIETTKAFYEKHGRKTIILARFVPVVRTFAPILAGVGKMNYRDFLFFNIFGGILWTFGLILLGYWLGGLVPNIDQYILPIILLIIFLSFIPVVIEIIRSKYKK